MSQTGLQDIYLEEDSKERKVNEAPVSILGEDGNASDCSDDEEATVASASENAESNVIASVDLKSRSARYSFRRLSSRFVPATDSVSVIDLSEPTLSKLDELISKFPVTPTHIPRIQEVAPPAYSKISSAAMSAVSFGFGSLRRGADKLGLFAQKK